MDWLHIESLNKLVACIFGKCIIGYIIEWKEKSNENDKKHDILSFRLSVQR